MSRGGCDVVRAVTGALDDDREGSAAGVVLALAAVVISREPADFLLVGAKWDAWEVISMVSGAPPEETWGVCEEES